MSIYSKQFPHFDPDIGHESSKPGISSSARGGREEGSGGWELFENVASRCVGSEKKERNFRHGDQTRQLPSPPRSNLFRTYDFESLYDIML